MFYELSDRFAQSLTFGCIHLSCLNNEWTIELLCVFAAAAATLCAIENTPFHLVELKLLSATVEKKS